ncbi:MAG: hypothetical protein HOJ35_07465 [Bdellovibrionales bacterium]|nr:hypothetical protein [Bdellovibrionales bacterium]
MISYNNIAGMSIKGGKFDNVFLSLLEYYPDRKRWFLKSLLQVKDSEVGTRNDVIKDWTQKYNIKDLVSDIPLTYPPCFNCKLECPGENNCQVKSVRISQEILLKTLAEDESLNTLGPKEYERKRNTDDEYVHDKNVFHKKTLDPILSKSFKRRLKKGISPHWNRPIDLWVWFEYYDQMLDLFNISFNSFGSTSLMTLFRFSYLKRHFPEDLTLYEGNVFIAYIELLRNGIISKSSLQNINHFEYGYDSRLEILESIEKKLKIFIYENDYEVLLKSNQAFNSFILSLIGRSLHLKKVKKIDEQFQSEGFNFVIPSFKL